MDRWPLIPFVGIFMGSLVGVRVSAQAPASWLADPELYPIEWRYDEAERTTEALGFVPLRTEEGEDLYLVFHREYESGDEEPGPVRCGIMRWAAGSAAPIEDGVLTIKITRSGMARTFDLTIKRGAEFPVKTVIEQGVTWQPRAANLTQDTIDEGGISVEIPGFLPEQLGDMVRHSTRGVFDRALFVINDKRGFRVVEKQMLDDRAFLRQCNELERLAERERVRILRRRFIDPDATAPAQQSQPGQPATTTPAPRPPQPNPNPKPLAPSPTHELELADGRVILGRLDSEPDADPIVFIVVVGSLEQPMSFTQDEVLRIITYRTHDTEGPEAPDDTDDDRPGGAE